MAGHPISDNDKRRLGIPVAAPKPKRREFGRRNVGDQPKPRRFL